MNSGSRPPGTLWVSAFVDVAKSFSSLAAHRRAEALGYGYQAHLRGLPDFFSNIIRRLPGAHRLKAALHFQEEGFSAISARSSWSAAASPRSAVGESAAPRAKLWAGTVINQAAGQWP
jgi:hypothetical protein